MKIAAIRTVIVNAQMRNWIFVKVETDQPGLHGWGEASLEWKTRAVAGAVEDLAPMLKKIWGALINVVRKKFYPRLLAVLENQEEGRLD